PRISSASSKPSISGICTSMRARATSCLSSSSSASEPERASSSMTPSRCSSARRASRLSSLSSTSRNFTGSKAIEIPRTLIDALLGNERRERRRERGEAERLLLAQPEKTLSAQRAVHHRQRAVLERAVEVDEHVAARDQLHLGEDAVGREGVVAEEN